MHVDIDTIQVCSPQIFDHMLHVICHSLALNRCEMGFTMVSLWKQRKYNKIRIITFCASNNKCIWEHTASNSFFGCKIKKKMFWDRQIVMRLLFINHSYNFFHCWCSCSQNFFYECRLRNPGWILKTSTLKLTEILTQQHL